MSDRKLRDILHLVFFSVFIIVNAVIFFFSKYKIKDNCECANEKVWHLIKPLDYIIWFSLTGMIMGAVNIFINFNQGLSSLPFLGTFFNIGIAILCVIQMAMIVSFLKKIDSSKCKKTGQCQDKTLKRASQILSSFGMLVYIGAIIISILLIWI